MGIVLMKEPDWSSECPECGAVVYLPAFERVADGTSPVAARRWNGDEMHFVIVHDCPVLIARFKNPIDEAAL